MNGLQTLQRLLEINAVWAKGRPIPGFSPDIWRWDSHGSVIRRSDYGDCNSEYGWEIDHIWPASLLGSEGLENKQPLNWRNNRSKGDNVYGGLGSLYGG